jgi:hypothetical protein
MKKLILALFISGNLFSQNWNVFNKNYRYNYRYNFSQLITNVLFADTVHISGTDTIYDLNRIGVECTGSCPTIPSVPNPTITYIVPNMPQFFQQSIRKYADGRVKLYDTTKIVIVPSCTLNQSWLFDSIYNKTAVCTDISTLTVFGTTDSVKTIIINNIDSLQLSKNFGIILFPDPYGKNKYYRLAGIEKKSSYDQNSLYGEKVPNAWDFYNYQVGDVICSGLHAFDVTGGYPYYLESCDEFKTTIQSKQPTNDSYLYYGVGGSRHLSLSPCGAPPGYGSYAYSSGTLTMSSFSSTALECNYLYPGMIYTPTIQGIYIPNAVNIIKLGSDNNGNLYKYCGNINNPSIPYPNFSGANSYSLNNGIYERGSDILKMAYATGFGEIVLDCEIFEHGRSFSITSFSRNGVSYFGNFCLSAPSQSTGIIPNALNNTPIFFYPNPASSSITFSSPEKGQIEIANSLGQIVLRSDTEGDQKIDISSLPNGIYFATLKNSSYSLRQKLLINH